jgi:hypothetical protein
MKSSRRLRVALLILGLFIIAGSLITLAYVYWPVETLHVQATLAPTLLAPP